MSNFILLPLLQVDHWLRPSEIATDSSDSKIAWTVFRTPLPSDISQGNFAQSSIVGIIKSEALNAYICKIGKSFVEFEI